MHIALLKDQCIRTTEVATLTSKSTKTIIAQRRKLGIKCPTTWGTNLTERPFKKQLPEPVEIVSPEVWNNKEWLTKAYDKYGVRTLVRIINRNMKCVKYHLDKFGIPRHSDRRRFPENPCCNKNWLEEHYIVKEKSLAACAKLANVNRYTIYNWLVTFKLPIRDHHEATSGDRNHNYGRSDITKSMCKKNADRAASKSISNQSQVPPQQNCNPI
jgi:hypothetical protein